MENQFLRTEILLGADAMKKLKTVLRQLDHGKKADQKNDAWKEHTRLQRGNPVRVYKGMNFKKIK